VDRGRIDSPRHYRASRFHQACRTLGRWSSDLRSAFYQYSTRAYQRTDPPMMTDQLIGNGHRWGQRIEVDIPVQVAAQASPAIHGHLKNLSLSGALMEADHELRLHAYIEVSIKLPEAGRSTMRVMARVARKLKDAVGVEWCEFAPSSVKDLLRSPSIRLPL
jgi:PilZ domain